MLKLPPLYALADAATLAAHGLELRVFAEGLRAAGVSLVQWRHKRGSPQDVLHGAAILREVFAGSACRLIMNDRADLALLAGFDGVHLGQDDLPIEDARRVLRVNDPLNNTPIIGVSTHTDDQVRQADVSAPAYIAIGPVFATESKPDAAPVVGLDGVRRARALTRRPLVAIGGITRENCRNVIDAGADSVAVISALLARGESVETIARDFLDILR